MVWMRSLNLWAGAGEGWVGEGEGGEGGVVEREVIFSERSVWSCVARWVRPAQG